MPPKSKSLKFIPGKRYQEFVANVWQELDAV